jgi:hypothetical protein
LAIDDSASIFCAREMRGTMSIAMTLAPLDFASSISASFWPGQKNEISVLSLRQPLGLGLGGRAHLGDDVGGLPERGGGLDHLDAGGLVGGVREPGAAPAPASITHS